MRGYAGGLLKESPTPPRTFLERIIIGGSRRSRPVPAVACALAWRRGLSLPLWCPKGGLPSLLPACLAFSLLFCPILPAPFPAGRGRPRFFSCKGLRPLHPRGCTRAALAIPAAVVPEGGLPCWSPAAPAFSLPACPHPPDPLPPRGRGRSKVYFAGGSAPGTPGIKPPAALTDLAKQVPGVGLYPLRGGAGVAFRYPAGAWQLRRGSGEQCRQPRRGGTGGEELRRLRWSSPPGQG